MLEVFFSLNPIGQGIIGVIILLFVLAIVVGFTIRSKYKRLTNDLLKSANREEGVFQETLNNAMVQDYKGAMKKRIENINTFSIIEKNLNLHMNATLVGERFVNKSAGLMIVLGLVGTFFGLTLSIAELVTLLQTTGETVISGNSNEIVTALLSSINGMSVAFVTSLFGIVASILVNVSNILFGISEQKESYAAMVEEYMDNSLGRRTVDMLELNDEGKTPLEASFETLSNAMEANLKELTSAVSYRLTVATKNMEETANVIQASIQTFDKSLKHFSDDIRDFSEFNHHLKTNIERMSVSFADFDDTLKTTVKEIKK